MVRRSLRRKANLLKTKRIPGKEIDDRLSRNVCPGIARARGTPCIDILQVYVYTDVVVYG